MTPTINLDTATKSMCSSPLSLAILPRRPLLPRKPSALSPPQHQVTANLAALLACLPALLP